MWLRPEGRYATKSGANGRRQHGQAKKGSDHSYGNLIEAKPREIVVLPHLSAVERERLLFG
jgi:hypothetical protein